MPCPSAWAGSSRGSAYAVVAAAALVGTLAPGAAARLLGPALLAGAVPLGVAHGACDQYVVPLTHPVLAVGRARYWAVFLAMYLGLAAAVLLLWWRWPGAALALFLGLTAWH